MVDSDSPISNVVGATLGLLALILAFTFGMTVNRYNERSHLLLEETNIISTLYARADLLPAELRVRAKNLILEYLQVRAYVSVDQEERQKAINRSEEIQTQLWRMITENESFGASHSASILYIPALNQLSDIHNERVVQGLQKQIPFGVWIVLLLVFIVAMWSMGFQFGYVGHYSIVVSFSVGLAFAAVIILIADIDRSSSGIVVVDQKPMQQLYERLNAETK
jgi:hypothetical protein